MFFVCKGKRLANYLIEHGSPVIKIDTDQQNKGFLIFIFERNQTLEDNLQSWTNDKDTYLID